MEPRAWDRNASTIVNLDGEGEFRWDRPLTPRDFKGDAAPADGVVADQSPDGENGLDPIADSRARNMPAPIHSMREDFQTVAGSSTKAPPL